MADWSETHKTAGVNISNGGLTADALSAANGDYQGRSDQQIFTGDKRYWEITVDADVFNADGYGVCNVAEDFGSPFFGGSPNAIALFADINVYYNGSIVSGMQTSGPGDVICIALDFDLHKIWFRVNDPAGSWNNEFGTHDPAAGTGGFSLDDLGSGPLFPGYNLFHSSGAGGQITANFGASAFAFTPPSGFTGFVSAAEGTLDVSLGAVALAGHGHVKAQGTLAATLGAATLAATAAAPISAGLEATLGDLTIAATGTVLAHASLSATLGSLTAIASGKVATRATLDATLASLDFEAHGRLAVAASLAVTLGGLTASSSGEIMAEATLDVTLGSLAIDAHGQVSIAATLAATLGVLTLAAQGHGPQEESPTGRIQLVGIMQQTSVPKIATALLSVPQMATAERRVSQRGLIDG